MGEWHTFKVISKIFLAGGSVGLSVGNQIMSSPDGVTWSLVNTPWDGGFSSQPQCFGYGAGLYVAAGFPPGTDIYPSGPWPRVMTSHDAINWTNRSTPWDTFGPTIYIPCAIAYCPWGFYMVVTHGRTSDQFVGKSVDGITWVFDTGNPFSAGSSYTDNDDVEDVFWVPQLGRLYFTGNTNSIDSNNQIYYTTDGISYTGINLGTVASELEFGDVGGKGVVTNDGQIFTAIEDDNGNVRVVTTIDGDTWTLTDLNVSAGHFQNNGDMDKYSLIWLAATDTLIIAGENFPSTNGSDVIIYKTTNRMNWTPALTYGAYNSYPASACASPSLAIVAGAGTSAGNMAGMTTSPDGTNWTHPISTPWDGFEPYVSTLAYL